MDYIYDFEKIIKEVTRIAGHEIDISKIEIIDRGIPHIPKSLKTGTMGVYTFLYNDKFLKIGKAGPNSNARFLSQHYTGSAMSTLSGSILADPDMEKFRLTKDNVVSTEQIPIFAAAIKSAKSAQTGAKGYAGFYADSTLQSTWQA